MNTIKNIGLVLGGTALLAGGFTGGASAVTGHDRSNVQRGITGALALAAAGVGVAMLGKGANGLPDAVGRVSHGVALITAGLAGSVASVAIDG